MNQLFQEVTVTSKNQITLPASIVRSLNINKNRRLTISVHNEKITLTPKPDVEEVMSKYWTKHNATKEVTEEDLKSFVRSNFGKDLDK